MKKERLSNLTYMQNNSISIRDKSECIIQELTDRFTSIETGECALDISGTGLRLYSSGSLTMTRLTKQIRRNMLKKAFKARGLKHISIEKNLPMTRTAQDVRAEIYKKETQK